MKKLSDFFGGFIVRMRLRTRGGDINIDNWKDPKRINLVAELNFAKEPLDTLCNLAVEADFPSCSMIS